MGFGVDYAMFPHPTLDSMKKAGVGVVTRYVSPEPPNDSNGKNLVPTECQDLKGAGFSICLVYEPYAPNWMLGGKVAGIAAAKDFDAVSKALGLPGIAMYCAADFDATPGQQAAINECLDGVSSVIGIHRTGIYGDFYVVSRALAASAAAYSWQTRAWSGGQWNGADVMRQGSVIDLGGAQVDADAILASDVGQWPRPSGVKRHVTPPGYNRSIDYLAKSYSATVDSMVSLSMTHMNAKHKAVMQAYMNLRSAQKAVSGVLPPLPGGFVYYVSSSWPNA